jgi:hypothetical protein
VEAGGSSQLRFYLHGPQLEGRDPLAPASVRDVLLWERNEPDHAERPAPWRQRSIAPRYRQDWRGMDALLKKVLSAAIFFRYVTFDVAVVSRGLNWERSQDARLRSDLPTSPSVSQIYHFQVARPQRPLWFTRGVILRQDGMIQERHPRSDKSFPQPQAQFPWVSGCPECRACRSHLQADRRPNCPSSRSDIGEQRDCVEGNG